MLIKFIGRGVGPVTSSRLLSKEYDFSTGQCEVRDKDAVLLLKRCAASYRQIEYPSTPDAPAVPPEEPAVLEIPKPQEPKLYTKKSIKARK